MKSIVFVLAVFAILAIAPIAFAQTNETTEQNQNNTAITNETAEQSPGITPDSPFWGLKIAFERLRLAFASDKLRADLSLKLADLRLREMQAMAKKGNLNALEKSEAERERLMDRLNETINRLENQTGNETLRGIELGMANHIAALEKVRAKIENNTKIPEETRTKLIEKLDAAESKAQNLTAKIEAKKLEMAKKQLEVLQKIEEREQNLTETKQKGCIDSGGNVSTATCCDSTGDFPNNCLIGACGCSLENSHSVKTCDCGVGKCFNGEKCKLLNESEKSCSTCGKDHDNDTNENESEGENDTEE